MRIFTSISLFILSLLISINSYSQEVISELQLEVGVIGIDILDPTLNTIEAIGSQRVVVEANLIDGLSINKVHYKIGTSLGGNDVKYGFVTIGDLISENNVGFVYTGNEFKMNLIPNLQSQNLYIELYIEDYDGNMSATSKAEYHH